MDLAEVMKVPLIIGECLAANLTREVTAVIPGMLGVQGPSFHDGRPCVLSLLWILNDYVILGKLILLLLCCLRLTLNDEFLRLLLAEIVHVEILGFIFLNAQVVDEIKVAGNITVLVSNLCIANQTLILL